jgi:serine/threonine-protein phosphatase 2A regulatory subunit A
MAAAQAAVRARSAAAMDTSEDKESERKEETVAVSALIEELRHEDVQVRLNSIRKLSLIAKALGPVRTREELVPYLNEFIDDDDEILLALAEELGSLIGAVGGPAHAHVLLDPLELLAGVEDTQVREKSTESVARIVEALSDEAVLQHVMPLLQRLAGGDWFTSRISGVSLFPVVYRRVGDTLRAQLRNLFVALCRDETPMVRRAACTYMARFAAVVEPQFVKSDLVPPFARLVGDDQDSVRLLTVENAAALARLLPAPEDRARLLHPQVRQLWSDKSWRVRYMVADKFADLVAALGMDARDESVCEAFVGLLGDVEAEVRTAAASRVADVARFFGPALVVQRLLPVCRTLAGDQSQYARAALAKVVMGLADALSRDAVVAELLPLFLQILRDKDPEVRLNIISRLETVHQVIGADRLSQSLLPAIQELASDPKWRVRLSILELVPGLATQLGAAFFEQRLSTLCTDWLADQVFSIRVAAVAKVTRLATIFGAAWTRQHILPRVVALAGNSNYLYRMTALAAFTDLARVVEPAAVAEDILPAVIRMGEDPVPNVRFNVAKALSAIAAGLSPAVVQSQVRPHLLRLAADRDVDVQYFASAALRTLG